LLDEVFRRSYARLEKRYASADEFAAALAPVAPPPLPGVKTAPGLQVKPPVNRSAGAACPQCHKPVDANDQFCMHCGIQLVSVIRRCQRCGAYPDKADRYCIFCGEELAATSGATA
jgi:hypothetical protein